MEKTSKKASKKGTSASENNAFAVIKTGGKQYRVSAGDTINIEIMNDAEYKAGDALTFSEVLMLDNGTDTTLGAPTVAGAKVTGEIVEIGRAAKVIVGKYVQKSRSGFRKNGHRQPFFKVKINAIA